jgi:Co/Zn/Cd efflux system component
MDCAAEEQLVRMAFADLQAVRHLEFDLQARTVCITHAGEAEQIAATLRALNMGADLLEQGQIAADSVVDESEQQRKLLWIVLAINGIMFVVEMVTGLLANSMGLVADSLDMLADALVYGLSLYAVGRTVLAKRRVARLSGYLQLSLGILGLFEVARRFIGAEEIPNYSLMIVISLIALVGNAASLVILQRSKSQDANIRASQIFTANDVLVNIGVIIAAILVLVSGSLLPDLVLGAIIFAIVVYDSFRILKLAKG